LGREAIQSLSRRGGTSGGGIHTYFVGGLVCDAGHRRTQKVVDFSPSSSRAPASTPPIVARVAPPRHWRVYTLTPGGQGSSGRSEENFFTANAPIPPDEILKTMSLVYHGIVPAFAMADYALLTESLHGLARIGFKEREVANYGNTVSTLVDSLE